MIGICADHAGYGMKADIIRYLEGKGLEVKDFGTNSPDSMDYPDVAHPLAFAIEDGSVDCGIALCGSGNGMAITLNKHQGVRAGLAWNADVARLVKEHNCANVLVLPARFISLEEALNLVDVWMAAEFQGGRHINRVKKIPLQ